MPMNVAAPTLLGTIDPIASIPHAVGVLDAPASEVVASAQAAAAPVMYAVPSLPSIAPAVPSPLPAAGPGTHQPSQGGPGVTARIDQPQNLASPKKTVAKQRRGGGLVRTVGLILFASILGAGANVGYGYWQGTTDEVVEAFDGTQLESWPQVELPAIRFADSTTLLRSGAGTRTITSHTNLVSGDRIVDVADTDPAGTLVEYTGDEALTLVGAPVVNGVFTISDVFPTEAIPFITVLEGVERRLAVGPISEARSRPTPLQPGASAEIAEPAKGSWHYRVIIDVEAFRANEPAAFETWDRRLGVVAVDRLEAWVDDSGIVRQFAVDVDGTSVVHTLVSGAPHSTKFQVPATPVGFPGADAVPTAEAVQAVD